MLTATWRRLGSPYWLAIALITLVPALAEAQLFPNRTIRRQKPPCTNENPYYAQVRKDYFGYYPTCWRKFPEGWQCPCPNPELPNFAKSFTDSPLDIRRKPAGEDNLGTGDDAPADGMNGPDRGTPKDADPNVPLPRSRSPFDIEKPNGNPGGAQSPAGDIFDTPGSAPAAPGNTRPTPAPGPRPGASSSLMEMPALPETAPTTTFESTLKPGSMVTVPDATLTSNDPSTLRPDLGPLPSAPTPSPNTPNNGSVFTDADSAITAPMPAQAPAQAPKRRGLLSSLFNRGNTQNR